MKNNCDVSGKQTNCTAKGSTQHECDFHKLRDARFPKICEHEKLGRCTSTAAIRAAIEADGITINCPDCGAERTLLCDCRRKADADKTIYPEERKITIEEEVMG